MSAETWTAFTRGDRRVLGALRVVAALVILGLFLAPRPALADKVVAVANPEYEAALEQLNAISEEYDALTAEQNETLTQLDDVRAQISDTEAQIADVQQQIDEGREELSNQQETLAGHISVSYKSGGVSWLDIILSATSFEDAVSKIYYHNSINNAQIAEIESINEAKAELQRQQDELVQLQNELQGQEADIEELYEQQLERAEQMYDRQVKAAELVESLPKEILETLEEDPEELANEAQAAIQSEEAREASKPAETESEPAEQPAATNEEPAPKEEEPAPTPTTPATSTAASGTLQRLIDTAYATGPTRRDWGCSGWVYIVFDTAGISDFSGSAAYFYNTWCYSSDRNELKPGMIIAVNNTGGSAAGRMYGHIGIYLGNNTVRHFTRGQVFDMSLDDWCRSYGSVCTPRWGWNGGVALS